MSLLSLFIFNASFMNNRNITDPQLGLSKVIPFSTVILKTSIFLITVLNGIVVGTFDNTTPDVWMLVNTIHDLKWFILFGLKESFSGSGFLPIILNIVTHSVSKHCLLWIFNYALLIRVFILISSSEFSLLQPWFKHNSLQFIKTNTLNICLDLNSI